MFGLVDCKNFFVSCERVFRPDLVGRPVVVLSNNDWKRHASLPPPRASDDDPCGQTRVVFPEEFGKESRATYYHQFKENMPFFIDYAFTNIQTFAFEIGKWNKSESDHCPLMIEL